MCVDEVSAVYLFFAPDAIGELSSMTSSMKRDLSRLVGYTMAKEGFALVILLVSKRRFAVG